MELEAFGLRVSLFSVPVISPIIPNVSSTCLCSICLASAVFLSPLTGAILSGSCFRLILLWCSVLLLKLSPKAHSLDPFLAGFAARLVIQRSVSQDLSGSWGVSLLFRFAGIINGSWTIGLFSATKKILAEFPEKLSTFIKMG